MNKTDDSGDFQLGQDIKDYWEGLPKATRDHWVALDHETLYTRAKHSGFGDDEETIKKAMTRTMARLERSVDLGTCKRRVDRAFGDTKPTTLGIFCSIARVLIWGPGSKRGAERDDASADIITTFEDKDIIAMIEALRAKTKTGGSCDEVLDDDDTPKRTPSRSPGRRTRTVTIELAAGGPIGELPTGINWEAESRTIRCTGNDPMTLVVTGAGKGNALRGGDGDGHSVRGGSGEGDALREGGGFGDARRSGIGKGDAIRDGDGDGNAIHKGFSAGDAIREGAGSGDAIRTYYGDGDAIRDGTGDGSAVRDGEGTGNAVRKGEGRGEATRGGPGVGRAYYRRPLG